MRSLTLVSLFAMFMITSNSWAVEPIDDQQVIFYYQIPFGGIKKADTSHKFGFRIDRVSVDRLTGQYSDSLTFNDLMKRPASLDLQMGHQGIAAFKMHGYDYLPQLISQADDEGGENGEVNSQGNGEASETEKGEEKKYLKLPELDQTNFGVLLGVGILIIAFTL
ncbi:MAG: hypothetical protein IH836_00835 [Proteobacteria bacterium]|nr:hypothetical protein [Pseudomonadota bacterium]MCH9047481.1 hypothetical protein [Pseudomonadota bacterium]